MGLLNLLAIWEALFPALKPYAQRSLEEEKGYSWRGHKFARSLGDRFPGVYEP